MNKKLFLSIIGIFFGIILISGSTYAWYKWRSSSSIDVIVNFDNTSQTVVTFYGGDNITGKITPSEYPAGGIIKQLRIESTLFAGDTFNLYLKINTLPNDMKVDYFKWKLTSCDLKANKNCANTATVNVEGNFTTSSMSDFYDSTTGDLLLLDGETIPLSLDLYLYIWIDGNVDNDVSIGSEIINFDVYAKGTSVGSFVEGS